MASTSHSGDGEYGPAIVVESDNVEEDWPACPDPTEENWRRAVDEVARLNR